MSSRTSPKVAVLMGGPSAEREVSLSSGRECAAASREKDTRWSSIDAGPDLAARLAETAPDVVFNALHGRWGEDGCVQGLLEWLRLPYTHSGVLASALAMDKERTKAAYRAEGLPVVESRLACGRRGAGAGTSCTPPYVVKPNNEGSLGRRLHRGRGRERAAAAVAEMPETVMVERFAPGRELTTTVMGDRRPGGDRHPDRGLVRLRRQVQARRLAPRDPGRHSRREFATPASTSRCARTAASAAAA